MKRRLLHGCLLGPVLLVLGCSEPARDQHPTAAGEDSSLPPAGRSPDVASAHFDSRTSAETRSPASPGGSRSDRIIAAKMPYDPSIPFAERGLKKHTSILDDVPEAQVGDPEREAAFKGYRDADVLEAWEFDGPIYGSAAELAEAVLDQILFESQDGLHALRINRREYDELVWPELPQSRPATNIPSGQSWAFHEAACRDGIVEAMGLWGGQLLHFSELRFEEGKGFTPFTNFTLYRGIKIHAVTEDGRDAVLRIAPSFIERNGEWKVFMYDA